MNHAPAGHCRDHARPERFPCIDEDDVGSLSSSDLPAIVQACCGRGSTGDQRPSLLEWEDVVRGQQESRMQGGRIVIVRGQNRAETLAHHIRSAGPPCMAAATHNIRRTKHREIAALDGRARRLLVDREFRDIDAQLAEAIALLRLFIIVRQ